MNIESKKLKRVLIRTAIIAVGFIVVSVGMMGYTSRPTFCKTCHYMEPFYEGWKTSAHSDIDCTVCHFEPGIAGTFRGKLEGLLQVAKYVSNAYVRTKPWAEISDESCLRSGCHVERLLEGEVKFKEGIIFNHKPHLTKLRRGKELRCTSCHSQIVQGDHITVTETTCFLCHFKNEPLGEELAECTLCHKQEVFEEMQDQIRYDHADVFEKDYDCTQCHTNTIMGDGAVHLETCYDCHFEPDRLAKIGDKDALHQVHITDHKIECVQCHLPIQHKIIKSESITPDDCTSCHLNLHGAQSILFSGNLEGHELLPNPMQEVGLNCRGCHIFHEETNGVGEETMHAEGKSCERCHGEGYMRLFKNWEAFADRRLKEIQSDYAIVTKAIENKTLSNLQRRVVKSQLEEAYGLIELVNVGKAVHNVRFSEVLLGDAHDKLEASLVEIGSDIQLSKHASSESVIPNDCINCHTGIVDNETVVFGLSYSHERHLVNVELNCRLCHSNTRKHGELTLEKSDCLSCHHGEESQECSYCHEVQAGAYSGESEIYSGFEPDIMFDSEVTCDECHRNEDGNVVRPGEEECAVCHDDGYGDMVEEWKDTNSESVTRIKNLIEIVNKKDLSIEDRTIVEETERLVRLMELDGSFGGHNFMSMEESLDEKLSQIRKIRRK